MEIQKNDYLVKYVDAFNDVIHTDSYKKLTKVEVWIKAECNIPKLKQVEDFIIEKID